MDAKEIKAKIKDLEAKIEDYNNELIKLQRLEKPYVANVYAYSGHYDMSFKTEALARKKYDEYFGKQYFRNGLNYGVYLYKWNEDGTKTLIEYKPKGRDWFKPNGFTDEEIEKVKVVVYNEGN